MLINRLFASLFLFSAVAGAVGAQELQLRDLDRSEATVTPQSPQAAKALAIKPDRWKFAESPSFYISYRRVTEARKVARETEFTLKFVAGFLGFTPDSYARKSHIFVFEDDEEWKEFLTLVEMPLWVASFAFGDELYLNVRSMGGAQRFNIYLLAHETTHAVMARLYPESDFPKWAAEGFAEFMAGASTADRKNQTLGRHQSNLRFADLTAAELAAITSYPVSEEDIARLYQSSERLFRFLHEKHPQDRLRRLLDAAAKATPLKDCITAAYADFYPSFEAFEMAFNTKKP